MLQNQNEYKEQDFSPQFIQTSVYHALQKDYDLVCFDRLWKHDCPTPRQIMAGIRPRVTKFFAVLFYYLGYLLDAEPNKIYDLGCGVNIFKKYIPNVIGIGAENPNEDLFYADTHDHVDGDFISGHKDFFESVFSINALHFITYQDLRQRVLDFHSMIRPGGRGWLSLNFARLGDRPNKSKSDLEQDVRRSLSNLDIEYLVVDIDFTVLDEWMNGNIRLVMKKNEARCFES